ncbi:adhesion G-protein coupled receptor D1-like [Mytilus edulis]|uniref:adhesion G-protein coupled receptor D1-like n=1 Tax=Mytilus edulis TaxID=6550 RepID=UPI0039F1217C
MIGQLFPVCLLPLIAFCSVAHMIRKDDFSGRISRATKDVIIDSHCTSRFTAFKEKCYNLVHKKSSWSQAKEECSKINSNLVTIKSLGEQKFVNEFISSVSFGETARVWIGLSRNPYNLSIFNWVDGTNVSYENWYKMKDYGDENPNEPNNEDEKCGNIFMETNKLGNWNDEKCEKEYFYICEKTPVQLISNISVDTNGKLSAIKGNRFTVRCVANTKSDMDELVYKWTLNNAEIIPLPSSRFQIVSYTNFSELSVRNTNPRDTGTLKCIVKFQNETGITSVDIVVYALRLVANPATLVKGTGTEVSCEIISNITNQLNTTFRLLGNGIYDASQEKYKDGVKVNIPELFQSTTIRCEVQLHGQSSYSKTIHITVFDADAAFCAPETDTYTFGTHNLTWNATNTGQTAYSSCPEGFDGMVSRKCKLKDNFGSWEKSNVTDCTRRIFRILINQLEHINDGFQSLTVEEILEVVSKTIHSLNNQSSLITGDINSGVIILEKSTGIFSSQNSNITFAETEAYLSATNTLLSSDTATDLWQEVGDNDAAKVMNITSTFAGVAFESHQNNTPLKISKPSLDVVIDQHSEGDITFHAFDQPNGTYDRLLLPKESLRERANTTGYIAIHYSTIAKFLPRKTSVDNKKVKVLTSVLSLTIPGISQTRLNPPLHLYFKNNQNHEKGVKCAYWDYTLEKNGFWSANGLKTVHSNSTFTECTSSHLTNFAVLLSLYEIPENHDEVLAVITQVGCSISIAALVLLLITYYIEWRLLPSDKSKILVTMAAVFLLAYVVFLAGIEGTENKVACKVVAIVLHFLFLVGIHMMVAEGIVHGKMLATVSTEQRSISPILIPIGWGIPVLIVAVSMAITKLEGYGDGKYCWLSTSNGLIWAFFVPCAVAVVTNFVIFVFVVKKLFSIQVVKKKTKLQQIISGLRCFSVLAPLFGFTWTLGFFSLNEDTIVFSYLFVIINSLQGLLIFIVHGLLNPKIQSSWKRKLSVFRKKGQFSTTTKTTEEITCDNITAVAWKEVHSSIEDTKTES